MAEKILVRNGRAAGVRTADGEDLPADQVVYTGDYRNLVGRILGPEHFSSSLIRKVQTASLTETLFNVYLGLNRAPEELSGMLKSEHVFYFPNYKAVFPDADSPRDIHRQMWVVLNFFGAGNPGAAPPGKSSVVLQTYSSYSWQNFWHNGSDRWPREQEYQNFRNEIGMQLAETAENILPGITEDIEYLETGTPLSAKRFTLNTGGSSGGWSYNDSDSFIYRSPGLNRIRTPVKNLWTAGHYSLWPGGVISAVLSGKMAAYKAAGLSMGRVFRSENRKEN
jgi:phytoene dehydrogenase-like protein